VIGGDLAHLLDGQRDLEFGMQVDGHADDEVIGFFDATSGIQEV
jgi:hypothetical protein